MLKNRFTGLWRNPDFMQLWAAETVSLLGSQITVLALSLTAAVILEATPEQMGVLNAAGFLPFLVIGLFAGVWVDRNRRKPILMIGDIGRAILLGSIPLAAELHILGMTQLIVVSFLVGILTVFFDVAYQSYLPSLVGREHLVEGNSKLEVSRSITQIAGPGVAGFLVQIFTAPVAIALDAVSFIGSAFFVWRIKVEEPTPNRAEQRPMLHEIVEGLRIVLGNQSLRSIAGCTSTSNLFGNIGQAVFILYATRNLNLDAITLGLIFGIASIGGLLGAVFNARIVKRLGLGTTIIIGMIMGGLGNLLVPLVDGAIAVPLIVVGFTLVTAGGTVYNINQVSLRQTITPHRLLGRMNASMRFIVWGTIPIGSLIGGFLGGAIGLRPTLFISAIGMLLAPVWIYFSPVRTLREQPPPVDDEPIKPEPTV